MSTRKSDIEALLLKSNAQVAIHGNYTIISYNREKDKKPCLCIYPARGSQPLIHLYYPSEKQRAIDIEDYINRALIEKAENIVKKAHDEYLNIGFVPGIILSTEGDVRFFKIVDRSERLITMIEIDQVRAGDKTARGFSSTDGFSIPCVTQEIGIQFSRKVTNKARVVISPNVFASLWDGKPVKFNLK